MTENLCKNWTVTRIELFCYNCEGLINTNFIKESKFINNDIFMYNSFLFSKTAIFASWNVIKEKRKNITNLHKKRQKKLRGGRNSYIHFTILGHPNEHTFNCTFYHHCDLLFDHTLKLIFNRRSGLTIYCILTRLYFVVVDSNKFQIKF